MKTVNNGILLTELQERLDKGEIKVMGDKLMGKVEKDNKSTYYAVELNLNVGELVNRVIDDLRQEKRIAELDKARLKERMHRLKEQKLALDNQNP